MTRLRATAKEVDFYKNPTILSRLVLNQKYASAISRLQRFPEEASTWVCSKRNPYRGRSISLAPGRKAGRGLERFNSSRFDLPKPSSPQSLEYSIRQLPIHVACANLLRTKDDLALRADLERFIHSLVITYPNACTQADHEGKLPLHEALWHAAKPETISILLMAAPLILHVRDNHGRNPLDLNRFRRGENMEQINQMLLRGTHFWEQARSTAIFKMEAMRRNQKNISDGKTDTPKEPELQRKVSSERVDPVTWIKLERRAIHLEQLLAGMYEHNYELGELVEELTTEKMNLQQENDKLQRRAPGDTTKLSDSNEAMKVQIMSLEKALSELMESSEHAVTPDQDTLAFFEEKNALLQEEVNDLTSHNRVCQMEVERFELLVESLQERLQKDISMQISTIPEGEVTSDEQSLASAKLDGLLDTIQSKSHYATERYLARKVLDLDTRLALTAHEAETQLEIMREENARLVRENEVLVAQVTRDNLQISRKITGSRAVALPASSSRNVNSFASDDLEDILHEAAASAVAEKGSPPKVDATVPRVDLPEIAIVAKRIYGKPLSNKLDSALRLASLSTASSTLQAYLRESKALYGDAIPPGLELALSKAWSRGADESGPTSPTGILPYRSTSISPKSSAAVSTAQDSVHNEIDNLLEKAALMYGQKIPSELAHAFRTASISSLSKKRSLSPKPSPRAVQPRDDDLETIMENLETLMEELQRLYGKPIPRQLTLALTHASLSSARFSCISALSEEEGIIHDPFIAASANSVEGTDGNLSCVFAEAELRSADGAVAPTTNAHDGVSRESHGNELDSVLEEAELLSGGKLPPTLIEAWRNISLDSYVQNHENTAETIGAENELGFPGGPPWPPSQTDFTVQHSVLGDTDVNEAREVLVDFVADDLNAIFSEAARIYSQPMRPFEESQGIVSERFLPEEKRDLQIRKQSQVSVVSTLSSGSDHLDDLDNMYGVAAESFNRER